VTKQKFFIEPSAKEYGRSDACIEVSEYAVDSIMSYMTYSEMAWEELENERKKGPL
jgi:hypothetical protein